MSLRDLQGKWRINSLEIDGVSVPAAAYVNARISVDGDRFVSTGMGADYSGRVSVDDATAPAIFSLAFEHGPEAGNINSGVYELTEGGWRFCINMSGGPAPDGFTTAPGSGRALQSLVRE
ncbi:MAG: TIGR03067 domain-containing protein [Hyphomonadaceae bacterium]|nr:TIGR03067 domain-containing protein [Hyphomonadaceae bacterium]